MTIPSSPIRDRATALAFLFGRIDYERTRNVPYRSRRFKLDRMRQLASRLGSPERTFPAVHVAGTKGKGSTAGMIASVLTAAGYRTGLYTSPHLHSLEERFVVDGQQCSEQELVELLAEIQEVVLEMDREAAASAELGPTYFEITTAAAMLHFQRRGVACGVLEVGLGGRLDSTNICHPAVSVITTISFDHMRQLGRTLDRIAREKAGIIKPQVTVVTGVEQREPFDVIAQVARENRSPLLALGRDFFFEYGGSSPAGSSLERPPAAYLKMVQYREQIAGVPFQLDDVGLAMRGRHQAANAAVAVATLRQLQRDRWKIGEGAFRSGLAATRCPARVELVGRDPAVILDAAHNPASVTALVDALREDYPTGPRLLVFATSVDKDVPQMLRLLLPHFEHVILTRYLNNPRAMAPETLARLTRKIAFQLGRDRMPLHVQPDPASAWRLAHALATPGHVICVAGSFFLAAEVRQQFEAGGQEALGAGAVLK